MWEQSSGRVRSARDRVATAQTNRHWLFLPRSSRYHYFPFALCPQYNFPGFDLSWVPPVKWFFAWWQVLWLYTSLFHPGALLLSMECEVPEISSQVTVSFQKLHWSQATHPASHAVTLILHGLQPCGISLWAQTEPSSSFRAPPFCAFGEMRWLQSSASLLCDSSDTLFWCLGNLDVPNPPLRSKPPPYIFFPFFCSKLYTWTFISSLSVHGHWGQNPGPHACCAHSITEQHPSLYSMCFLKSEEKSGPEPLILHLWGIQGF